MKVKEIVEARRNPESNSDRLSGHRQAVQYLINNDLVNNPNIGISMTEEPKLGLNPLSEYSTPLGVYFYPADYYVKTVTQERWGNLPGKKLPFQHDTPYIQIFSYSGDQLDISDVSDDEYNRMMDEMAYWFKPYMVEMVEKKSEHEARVKSNGGRLWYTMYYLTTNEKSEMSPHVNWNNLIRSFGYTSVIDRGKGIIHPNEPTQGFVVDPTVIKRLEQIQKSYQSPKAKHKPLADLLKNAIEFGDPVPKSAIAGIARDPTAAYLYAVRILRKRFEQGEAAIASHPKAALNYAKVIIGGPWPQGEAAIAQDPASAIDYARNVLHDPDPTTWASRYQQAR